MVARRLTAGAGGGVAVSAVFVAYFTEGGVSLLRFFNTFKSWAKELTYSLRWGPEPEYQAFIDRHPITRYPVDVYHRQRFGVTRSVRLPELLTRFDWFIDHRPYEIDEHLVGAGLRRLTWLLSRTPSHRRVADPHTVYAAPSSLKPLLATAARDFDASRADRVLVVGGSDTFLSAVLGENESERLETALQLRRYFGTIFYQAKDIAVEGVETMPFGLNEAYLRRGVRFYSDWAIANSAIHDSVKQFSVLAAWGRHQPFEHFDAEDLKQRHKGVGVACRSRQEATEWAQTDSAKEVGVFFHKVEPEAWWPTVMSFRFLITPVGGGIQSPKMIEALLVLTVPIVQRSDFPVFDDLVRYGFPLAVVDSWTEITNATLAKWWREISPRLEAFRESCLTAEGYWQLFTGSLRRCGV
eukprot:gnl/TRDRNA2_/TRDRNA2_86791_c0_seq1.p1 gnl/TRDRNA2_/TRDRNA2_86791_c0~~gnl/TRDRNA2_/TRDRNA2_86791_c0_seq1.p1  ORF type:complete len:411 (-),score=49.41 gnl/TRDRNA2_/TRDRNA2_86791_c0_seq1:82-1314(-)